jgi:hypothetical protein
MRLLPRYPRWVNRIYAWLFGYFWLPCPICRRYFGGHEWGPSALIVADDRPMQGVCELCANEADRRNADWRSTRGSTSAT